MGTLNDKSSIRAVGGSSNRVMLAPVVEQFVAGATTALGYAFDAIDDTLFDLANNARSNNDQNKQFEAMREIRLKRRAIEASFAQQLKQRFDPSEIVQTPIEKQTAETDSLSLVDQHDLERNLAVDTMAQKIEGATKESLVTLSKRLIEAYSSDEKNFCSPVSAKGIVQCISTSCEPLEIQLTELLLLLKHIEKHLLAELPTLFSKLDEELSNLGILSGLTAQQVRRSSNPRQNQAAHVAHQPKNASAPADRPAHTPAHSDNSAMAVANRNELVEALSSIDARLLGQNAANQSTSLQDLTTQIQRELQSQKSKALSTQDLDLINLVSLLFEYILNDGNLAAEMRALIGRLQIPVLKVVIQDPDFFNQHNHPARSYLDTLARAAIGWSGIKSKSCNRLLSELTESVDFVLANADRGNDVFMQANKYLSLYLEREEKRREIVELRTRRTEEGRIKSRMAQQHVDQTLSSMVTHNTLIPQPVLQLLDGPWRRVMFFAYLKDAEQHNWELVKGLAEELIWCTEHHQSEADRQKWVTIVPRLLKQLALEMSKISISDETAQEHLNNVRRELSNLFRESSLSNQTKVRSTFKKQKKEGENTSENSSSKLPDQRSVETSPDSALEGLQIGQWVEFSSRGESGKQRYKLVSHIPEADVFVFVDRRGLSPMEKSISELREDMQSGRFAIIDKTSLIDRALSQMINNFKR